MSRPRIDCFVPAAPELQAKIIRTKQFILAGTAFPKAASADILDLRTFALITNRPSTRNNTFFAPNQRRAPIVGIKRVLVLLVDFSDTGASQTQTHYNDMLFSSRTYATGSLHDFYQEISYDKLTVTGLVSGTGGSTAGWYRAPKPKSYYTNGNYGFGLYPQNVQKLVEEAVDMAAPFVNYADYDNDGDRIVDALVIVAAGTGAEITGNVNDIWSHKWEIAPKMYNGVMIQRYNLQPEYGGVGVFAHELGHLLCGWPDLYDTDYSSAGTGNWDLMAEGGWNGGGTTPAHPTCWCKIQAGWINPITIFNMAQSLTLKPYATDEIAYKLPVGSVNSQEYFLITNRSKIGFDSQLPGEGMLIEHVDDTQNNNTNEMHYLVDVVQADGRQDLNKNANRGDADDPYPTANNREFTPKSTPSSHAYSGTDSHIAVTNIQRSGNNIILDINVAGPMTAGWHYDKKITSTYTHYSSQWAWAYITDLGWRRLQDGSPYLVTNMFIALCDAMANGYPVHIYADSMYIYSMYSA
jgi:immune inhibitor A